METTENPNDFVREFHKKIQQSLEPDQIMSILTTCLGMADLMGKFLFSEFTPEHTPIHIKYAILQAAALKRVLGSIVHNQDEEEFINFQHLPVNDEAWKTLDDFEKRFYFVVKKYYLQAVQEGKIT